MMMMMTETGLALRVILLRSDNAASAIQRERQNDSSLCQSVVAASL